MQNTKNRLTHTERITAQWPNHICLCCMFICICDCVVCMYNIESIEAFPTFASDWGSLAAHDCWDWCHVGCWPKMCRTHSHWHLQFMWQWLQWCLNMLLVLFDVDAWLFHYHYRWHYHYVAIMVCLLFIIIVYLNYIVLRLLLSSLWLASSLRFLPYSDVHASVHHSHV